MTEMETSSRACNRRIFVVDEDQAADDFMVREVSIEASATLEERRDQAETLHVWLAENKVCPCRARTQAEEALAQKVEALVRSNRDLEQFAYVASHDLQEPLRMVAAYTQLLAERYRGKFDESADRYLGYATEGALRMQTLIQDLLKFSRVDGQGVIPGKIDCNEVVKQVLQDLGAAIEESGAIIATQPLPTIWADRFQLVQLFQNLIGNALKFRAQRPPSISIAAERQTDYWLFSVSDNGIGIAPEYVEKIFAVFQRLHTRSEYPGNGIGLAVCKKVVEHYGGKIWVESEFGERTTFKFTWPDTLHEPGRVLP